MNDFTEFEIEKLTESLPAIRKLAGWSSEELGELIGVTKQTISNIETRKTKMSKTQYIAIRAVIDWEISDHPENELLAKAVEVLLNGENNEDDNKKAVAVRKLIDSTPKSSISSGNMAELAGILAILASSIITSSKWIQRILK